MGPSLVSILVVILTITFGSVANMHISIRKLINSSKDKQRIRIIAGRARKSINSDAWALFGIFIAVLLLLSFYGFIEDKNISSCNFIKNENIKSVVISICIMCIIYNILIMYDIYSAILMMASVDIPESESEENTDFTKKSPPC